MPHCHTGKPPSITEELELDGPNTTSPAKKPHLAQFDSSARQLCDVVLLLHTSADHIGYMFQELERIKTLNNMRQNLATGLPKNQHKLWTFLCSTAKFKGCPSLPVTHFFHAPLNFGNSFRKLSDRALHKFHPWKLGKYIAGALISCQLVPVLFGPSECDNNL